MARRTLLALTISALFVAGCRSTTVDVNLPLLLSTTTTTTEPTPLPTTTSSTVSVPVGVDPDSSCLRRARFGDPAGSDYRLPFPVGESYVISQSYCFSDGGHRGQFAYDFVMPIGVDILAARAGTVRDVREDSPDNGEGSGEHNFVFIEHENGSVAFYAHLMQEGVDVEVGDTVRTGQRIAASGNSGLTGRPHLHFGVYRYWPPSEGADQPVNFSNADGPLDPNGGLMRSKYYEALP